MGSSVRELVEAAYAALRSGDREALERTLAAEFTSHLVEGMPAGGGRHAGPADAINRGWWAIGRAYAVLPEPEEWIACEDGRLLVRGRYTGSRRADGAPVAAAFMHLWRARDDGLVELWQVTDTARWDPPPRAGG